MATRRQRKRKQDRRREAAKPSGPLPSPTGEHIPAHWAHLPIVDGVPVPCNADGGPTSGWSFSATDPSRSLYLATTMRCAICGHVIRDPYRIAAYLLELEAKPQLVEAGYSWNARPNGTVTLNHPTDQRLQYGVLEGYFHDWCLGASARICPFMSSADHRFRLAHVDVGANIEIDESRIGEPSGPKLWFNLDQCWADPRMIPQNLPPIQTVTKLPMKLLPVDGAAKFPVPEIDLDDPLPGIVSQLDGERQTRVIGLMSGNLHINVEPGKKCPCGAGDRYGDCCHPRTLPDEVAQPLIDELASGYAATQYHRMVSYPNR